MDNIKEQVIAIWSKSFEEVMEEKTVCPKCEDESLIRHIVKEPAQGWIGRWFVEYCDNRECPHWDCGFLNKNYKPQGDLRRIAEVPKRKKRPKREEIEQ